MTAIDNCQQFYQRVAVETEMYVTKGLSAVVGVLVPENVGTSEVFDISAEYDMICTGVNTLSSDRFDVELTFHHITITDCGERDA